MAKPKIKPENKPTVFVDISNHQAHKLDNSYPYHTVMFRCNDGNFDDPNFKANLAAARKMQRAKMLGRTRKLECFGIYITNSTNGDLQAAFNEFKKVFPGKPGPRFFLCLDVESWGGKVTGDHSKQYNAVREEMIQWLNAGRVFKKRNLAKDRLRVVAYGNVGDRAALWPKSGSIKWAIADYSGNPTEPNELWHQYSDSGTVAPFGHPVDLDSADHHNPVQFAQAVGCW